MRRAGYVAFSIAVGILVPRVSYAQAAAVVVSVTIPDATWIERHCANLKAQVPSDDGVKQILAEVNQACATYMASLRDQQSRDTWLKAVVTLQDTVSPRAMQQLLLPRLRALPANFESYSLFLIPDASWLGDKFDAYRRSLWSAFSQFGQSIGDKHLAVWFEDHEGNPDYLRSQHYCDQFDLNYNDGPYIVTVRKRPDLLGSGDEAVVVRLGGISAERTPLVLNRLSQYLRRGHGTSSLVYEEIRQRLITTAERPPDGLRTFLALWNINVPGGKP
jgi:hypothetical protein